MEKQFKPVPDVECLKYHGTPEKPDIKIFVSHRIDLDSETIDNPLYIPVRCGAVYDERENVEMLGDDTGDNISEKRMSFCELTVQYWAWKNVKADYYGLCHYRRYIPFTETNINLNTAEHSAGCIVSPFITSKAIENFGLDENTMREIIKRNDIVAFKPLILGDYGMYSNYDSMVKTPKYHVMSDVDLIIKIISKRHPKMLKATKLYFGSSKSYLYNCYVMKADLWNEYCTFLFDVLFELEKELSMENYSITQIRTYAAIAERLWGVFLFFNKNKHLQIKETPLIFFENIEKNSKPKPFFDNNTVVIASNFNNNYFPIFTVFLTSILDHISSDRNYDYIIISYDISKENKKTISKMIEGYHNFSVRYYDPSSHFEGINLQINSNFYTKDLYSRLIIPYILEEYDKALVLDVDAICCCDVAEMYDISVENYYMGGVSDLVYQGWLNGYDPDILSYAKGTLKLKDPYKYCNTGMIILNLKEIRDNFNEEYILIYINNHHFMVYEQDTINVLFQGRIKLLDTQYNLYTYTNNRVKDSISFAPYTNYSDYIAARDHPSIIHYADRPKPWENPFTDFASDFWKYARKSPLYEQILVKLIRDEQSIQVVSNPIGVKGALVNWFKKHTPKWLRPFAKKVKRLLKW